MTITGLSGDIGSGKSWKMLHFALEQTNSKQKYLVTNFGLNKKALKLYCAAQKQWWNVWMIEHDMYSVVSCIPSDGGKENLSIVPLFKDRKNSVCVLDEAGIFLNSRNFKNTPAQLLMDLAQSRKDGNDLIWAAQFDTQVDVQFRNLTQFWIHCDGWTAYDKKMRRPALVWKTYFHFKGAEYERWQRSTKARTSFIRTWFAYAFSTQFGRLTKADKMLFDCFDSFTRLEKQQANAREIKMPSYKTEQELIDSGYYKKVKLLTLRAAVKRGALKIKPKEQPSPPKRKTSYDFSNIKPIMRFNEDDELPVKQKLKLKPLSPFFSSALFFTLGVALFFSLYQLLDRAVQQPRRVPLAGGGAAPLAIEK